MKIRCEREIKREKLKEGEREKEIERQKERERKKEIDREIFKVGMKDISWLKIGWEREKRI